MRAISKRKRYMFDLILIVALLAVCLSVFFLVLVIYLVEVRHIVKTDQIRRLAYRQLAGV